ncbi:MAG: ribonuclease H-like domain-containing protein [Candidatus Omnitrophota bacterium]
MTRIVFDIETVGQEFELLDETSKDYFLKFADTDEKKEEAKDSLSFYPLTAQIVAIAMLETDSEKGFVYFQNGAQQQEKFAEGDITFTSGTEREILEHFWNHLQKCDQFVTFNGRLFDCPFVMIRSAIHKIRTHKNLVPYRYSHNPHIDLADQLSFYDALRRKFSLHMWCKAFGIKSPKESGLTGLEVKDFFKEGRYREIARYCMDDVYATKELFKYWNTYLKFA